MALSNSSITEDAAQLLSEMAEPPLWLKTNFTEPRVYYALQDIIRSGWICYDVGANFGGLTVAMSRLTGPRGIVCGFEANPAIAAKCQRELLRSGAYNTQLFQGAIYKTSGDSIELFLSDNAVADSIYRKTDRSISVQTIALDDFIEQSNLVPDIIKMDIEGAEYDALLGLEKTLSKSSPIFILEHNPADTSAFDYLLKRGYIAIDLQNYQHLRAPSEVASGTVVTDVLYAPPEKLVNTAYENPLSPTVVTQLQAQDFEWRSEQLYVSKEIKLQPGRYLAHLEFEASGEANTLCSFGDAETLTPIVRVHASSRALVGFARDMVFDTPVDAVRLFFQFLSEPDKTVSVKSVEIKHVPGFDAFRPKFRMMA